MLNEQPLIDETEEIREVLIFAVDELIKGISEAKVSDGEFAAARLAIEALPLTTDEFCVTINRLKNAQRYLDSGERGAASYELKMLSRRLTSNEDPKVITRRLRKRLNTLRNVLEKDEQIDRVVASR